jgi:hypothetical protein
MSDAPPTPPPVGEPITYRPLSGFAVGGFAAACLFALLGLIATAVALYQGVPFFYTPWVLLVPATGLVLSLVARGHIRSSEGTRAGESLATAGFWLSLVAGLIYFVYYYVTGLTITSQANSFLTELGPDSGFFPHLQKAADSSTELYHAFLLSTPATDRGDSRPENEAGMLRTFDQSGLDGAPGPLTSFKRHMLVRLILSTPPADLSIVPLGVQSWVYENRSYKVRRSYRVTVPEGTVEFSILVQSTEAEAVGEERKWSVPMNQIGRSREASKISPLGLTIQKLRERSRIKLDSWKAALNAGEPLTLSDIDQTAWTRILPPQKRDYVKGRVVDLFASRGPQRMMALTFVFQEEFLGDWNMTPDKKLQLEHAFRLAIDPRDDERPYAMEGNVVVETKEPIDLAAFGDHSPPVEWIIRSFTITRAVPINPKKAPVVTPPGG